MAEMILNDVQLRAKGALYKSPVHALRELTVEQTNDAVLISGRVKSFYHKQLAQEVVRSICDGMQVVNTIRVD